MGVGIYLFEYHSRVFGSMYLLFFFWLLRPNSPAEEVLTANFDVIKHT